MGQATIGLSPRLEHIGKGGRLLEHICTGKFAEYRARGHWHTSNA